MINQIDTSTFVLGIDPNRSADNNKQAITCFALANKVGVVLEFAFFEMGT